eukprot:1774874-Amphidinium_carterae.1
MLQVRAPLANGVSPNRQPLQVFGLKPFKCWGKDPSRRKALKWVNTLKCVIRSTRQHVVCDT